MDKQIMESANTYGISIAIVIGTIVLAMLTSRVFKKLIQRGTDEMQNDPTNYQFLGHLLVALVYIIGFSVAIYSVPELRGLANSLLAGAGILAIAVGFASQHALSNVISGMFIVIFKPFRINDRLHIRDMSGVVEDITLRHTVIRNFENRRIIIPNAVISDEIIVNADFKDERICKWVEVGISYDSDIDKAKAIIQELAENHPLCIDNRTPEQLEKGEPKVAVRVLLLGEYAVTLRAWVWAAKQQDAFNMGCDLYEAIKKRFDKEGIEIPFPHRTLVYKYPPKHEETPPQ